MVSPFETIAPIGLEAGPPMEIHCAQGTSVHEGNHEENGKRDESFHSRSNKLLTLQPLRLKKGAWLEAGVPKEIFIYFHETLAFGFWMLYV